MDKTRKSTSSKIWPYSTCAISVWGTVQILLVVDFLVLSTTPGSVCSDFRAFKVAYVQNIVRSKLPTSRLSCVQRYLCPEYRAFIRVSRPCNFERTTPPCAFISVWTYQLSVWDLSLVYHI